MLRKASFVAGLSLLATLIPSVAKAQDFGFMPRDWEFTLSGSGSNDKKFEAGSFGISGSIGYFFTKELELSLRQSVDYADNGDSSAWSGSTRVALDYHFHIGRFVPFIGANIGYVYGEHVADTWEAAPEAGVKFFVNATTFIYGTVEYEFFFRNGGEAGRGFDNGQFVYSIGIGFRWPS